MNRFGSLLLLLALAGCGGGRWARKDYTLVREVQPVAEVGSPISRRIVLIADNQRHDLLGGPVDIFRTGLSDRMVSVAIRPPQLDLFGQDFLKFALERAGGAFVLHLGDACNLSTTTEFARFAWDMRHARGGWAMAPGNHDGYIFGNSSRKKEFLLREWEEAAERWFEDGVEIRGGALNKDRFVSFYLASLILQDQPWSEGLAKSLGVEGERLFSRWRWNRASAGGGGFAVYWRHLNGFERLVYRRGAYPEHHEDHSCPGYREFVCREPPPGRRPYLRHLVWHIDTDRPWKSYVTQEIDIGPRSRPEGGGGTSVLVLDTSHYGTEPGLDVAIGKSILTLGMNMGLAGTHGNLLESQMNCALLPMVERMNTEGRRWVVVGHHPYDQLSRVSRSRLDALREAGGIPLYVSAHSHFGEYRWHEDDDREGAWPELNVGSILDWPMEFRDFRLFSREHGSIALRSKRVNLARALAARGLLLDDEDRSRARDSDPDHYLAYRDVASPFARSSEIRVRRVLAAAFLRMLEAIPTDHPDQSSTRWPRDREGKRLTGHEQVVAMLREILSAPPDDEDARLHELNRCLYELRAWDDTRNLTDGTRSFRRRYRLSQAVWAARAESSVQGEKTAEVDPRVSWILFPRPARVSP